MEEFPKIVPPQEDVKLHEFIDVLNVVQDARSTCREIPFMDNRAALRPLVEKLPARIVTSWREYRINRLGDYDDEEDAVPPTLPKFIRFLRRQASKETSTETAVKTSRSVAVRHTAMRLSDDVDMFFDLCDEPSPDEQFGEVKTVAVLKLESQRHCSHCNRDGHLTSSYVFSQLTKERKRDSVHKNNLCYRCLLEGHMISQCTSEQKCFVDNCGKVHAPALFHVLSAPATTQPSKAGKPA